MSIFNGVAGRRPAIPLGVCFHNDAGSASANCGFYEGWLPNHNPESGFAHAYVADDGVLMAEDLANKAWHCGSTYGNTYYLSIEICQSMGDEQVFKENEQKALDLAASWFKLYGWGVNSDTVKVHREFTATSCPHRSDELHGDAKEYFMMELEKRLAGGKEGEDIMRCFYSLEGGNAVFYFDGIKIHTLTHPDQITILNRIYKDCNGKDMPSYIFSDLAPWHIRLAQAINGKEVKA